MKAHITTKCKPCQFCGSRADEIENITGIGVFKCRCCGAEIKEKTNVTRSVAWAIRDMIDGRCDAQSTTAIPKSSIPERFIVHWCEKTKFCVCDLIGWEIEEGDNDPHVDT